jgi:magnesium transporter
MPTDPSRIPPSVSSPRIRIIYRAGSGEVRVDWPAERIGEAIQDEQGTVWVDIDDDKGSNVTGVEALFREVFQFHPLSIEDALQESNVPKLDDWSRYLYLVFHSIDFDPDTDDLRLHQLDIFLGQNYLVTYHFEPMPIVDQLRRILEGEAGSRLSQGADHLLYNLLDIGVSDYMPVVEHLDDAIDQAQDEVFRSPTPRTLQQIFRIKRSAMRLHRLLIPQREVLNRLARDPYPQIDAQDRVYFRDVYDHIVLVHDTSETLRDLISGAMDTYLSAVSYRSNEIMKILTIVTVMSLPLNFIVGFFGMNFFAETMAFTWPKLPSTFLFWSSFLVMALTPPAIWIWARRRGWFGSDLSLLSEESGAEDDPARKVPALRSRPDLGANFNEGSAPGRGPAPD